MCRYQWVAFFVLFAHVLAYMLRDAKGRPSVLINLILYHRSPFINMRTSITLTPRIETASNVPVTSPNIQKLY
jgi:hypothetical protein